MTSKLGRVAVVRVGRPGMAAHSGARGKGGRRGPWRDGGARKRRAVGAWRNRTRHMTENVDELDQPIAHRYYDGAFGHTPEHAIYVLDQELGRRGVRYFAQYGGVLGRCARFLIHVAAGHENALEAALATLRT